MASVDAIEKERVNGRKYVTYDLKAMHPDIPDDMEPEYAWFKYWVNGIEGGASRREVYEKNLLDHDYFRCDPGKLNFRVAEKILRDKLIPPGTSAKDAKNAETIIGYFKKLTTINAKDDKTCKLMIYAGARINWEPLLNDIGSARTPTEVSKVLQTLTAEVRASAMKGAFSYMYNAANHMGKDPSKVTKEDEINEANLLKVYNKVIHGDKNSKPIDISADPSAPFNDVDAILKVVESVKEKKGLTPQQIYKELILPVETNFNKIKSISKGKNK